MSWVDPNKAKVVLDVEVYKNYFLILMKSLTNTNVVEFRMFNDDVPLDVAKLRRFLNSYCVVTFNGDNYDIPIIQYAMNGASSAKIKELSDKIIVNKLRAWDVRRTYSLDEPTFDHIDLMSLVPKGTSLKLAGARIGVKTIQDLPIDPSATITEEDAQVLRLYCENDLDVTAALYKYLQSAVDLRSKLSAQYGIDVRSKSDAQIAETILKSEISQKISGKIEKPNIKEYIGQKLKYTVPDYLTFQTKKLQDLLEDVRNSDFDILETGSISLGNMAKRVIKIGDTKYKLGLGGLHSQEKGQWIVRGEDEELVDIDATSYYPSIILNQNLFPPSLGPVFLVVFRSIVERRIKAKGSMKDISLSEAAMSALVLITDVLKIAINGTFGKLGSIYSFLFAPELLLRTTLSGQLFLLMLIEDLHMNGITVRSANTDGIVIHTNKRNKPIIRECMDRWIAKTAINLEETHYDFIASRDVNNYFAMTTTGKIKVKGCFNDSGLDKNPDCHIVYKAVVQELTTGIPSEQTIRDSRDILDFVIVRKVAGGAMWRGEEIGKVTRYYQSSEIDSSEAIVYKNNGNKVSKSGGARPMQRLLEEFPSDVDYEYYIQAAERLMSDIGYEF